MFKKKVNTVSELFSEFSEGLMNIISKQQADVEKFTNQEVDARINKEIAAAEQSKAENLLEKFKEML